MKIALRLVRNNEDGGMKRWTIELCSKYSYKPDANVAVAQLAKELRQIGVEIEQHNDVDNTKLRLKEKQS